MIIIVFKHLCKWSTNIETVRAKDKQKYKQTDRQTDRKTERQTDRQTNRKTDRQTDKTVSLVKTNNGMENKKYKIP